jgi:4-hydroxy-3-polyprenylbenzoate decarboxylase
MSKKNAYNNLGEFIHALDAAGELKTIKDPVSQYLEISRLTDAESKSPKGGKALYFEKVIDSPFPAATNLFGSSKRICMAMGVDHLDDLAKRMRSLLHMPPPANLCEVLGLLPMALSVSRFFPRQARTKKPACQEVILAGGDIDLFKLPVLHCWPQDAGRFVTLPLVFTRSLVTGKRNLGMYRLQIFDKNTTGMHWHIHKDGSHFYNEYRQAQKRMPVAVAIGADPATIYAATAPMPRNMDELILAGFIRNKPVALTKCVTCDLEVPAEAEFVIEGYVDPDELRREGPFGDHTGYYSLADDYPVFHVTAITHRKNPVYCATLVGKPPMEDCYLAKATERLFLPLLQTTHPEVIDYWLPWEGVFHNIVVVAVEKEFAGHAHKVIHGLWGQGQMSFSKVIVVVDKSVDLNDSTQVLSALLTNLDLNTDLISAKGVLDVLDHSSPTPNFGAKVGLDLTERFSGEPVRTDINKDAKTTPPLSADQIKGLLANLPEGLKTICAIQPWDLSQEVVLKKPVRNRILLIGLDRDQAVAGQTYAEQILSQKKLAPYNIVLLYDANIDLKDMSLILWKLFNNVDPERDLHFKNSRVVVDACRKTPADGHLREWPGELTFDES